MQRRRAVHKGQRLSRRRGIRNPDFGEGVRTGTDMREVLMMNDTVIEFEVGANRPDCLSVLGIAKEAAAALEETVKLPETDFEEHGRGYFQTMSR